MEAFCLRASLITAPTLQHFPDQQNQDETSQACGPSEERLGSALGANRCLSPLLYPRQLPGLAKAWSALCAYQT